MVAKLKELNPGYDGQETHKIEKGVVTELAFSTVAVADISPVRALSGLKKLTCQGEAVPGRSGELRKGLLADLSPLRGLKLESLKCNYNRIVDLEPLTGMPLRSFTSYFNYISDLKPLTSSALTSLALSGNNISDLSPLRGMRLLLLMCHEQRVRDLSPIAGMPLKTLTIIDTSVTDLSPLRGMRLEVVSLGKAQTDFSLLADMPLKDIQCEFSPQRDTALLKSIKTLKTINKLPADEFWKLVAAGKVPNFKGEVKDTPSSTTDDAFLREVAALPAEQQVARVVAKLKELNPGYDGQETHKIENSVVTELKFSTVAVADISPVRALTGLRKLTCGGEKMANWTNIRQGKLVDLTPLKGVMLEEVNLECTEVSDLSPLKGMPLKTIRVGGSPVSDLSPLASMPLDELCFNGTQVSDLNALRGLPLRKLAFNNTDPRVKDLSPLRGMPLESMTMNGAAVSDLSPLKGMRLTRLHFSSTPVRDLSPLRGMPIISLAIIHTGIEDLSPVKDMPLVQILFDPPLLNIGQNREILRSIKTLQTINDLPAAEFWKKVEAEQAAREAFIREVAALPAEQQVARVVAKLKELNPGYDGNAERTIENGTVTRLVLPAVSVTNITPVRALAMLRIFDCGTTSGNKSQFADIGPLAGLPLTDVHLNATAVGDLSPLRGMPLTKVRCSETPVSDLSSLAGMPLAELDISYTRVSDLSPLKGMPLEILRCNVTGISDLTPLQGMPLKLLLLHGTQVKDLSVLRDMPLKELRFEQALMRSQRNRDVVRSLTTLETINKLPAAEFWKKVEAGELPKTK